MILAFIYIILMAVGVTGLISASPELEVRGLGTRKAVAELEHHVSGPITRQFAIFSCPEQLNLITCEACPCAIAAGNMKISLTDPFPFSD
jgi:hypothetical protein